MLCYDQKDFLELIPREGLIALLATILALFVPVTILVIERSRDKNLFPWEEKMAISQIACPKILFLAIIGASLSCTLWNKIIADTWMLPFILILYVVCIVLICWIMFRLYQWLILIVSGKKAKNKFRLKEITKYFENIETDDDRIQVWLVTFDKIEHSTLEEQSQLIRLYLKALRSHANSVSQYCLVQCFIDNIQKLDIRELQPILDYSLTITTFKEADIYRKAMGEKLLLAILNTLKDSNALVMEQSYDVIQRCENIEQSYLMTKKLACKFFAILAQEDYNIQDTIIDNFSYSYKWDFRNLITTSRNKKLYAQTCQWLSEYTKWLIDQYIKQFDIRKTDRYYNERIIEKISESLFRNCDIDQQMFVDMILFYCPIGYTPQPGESDAETHVRAFVETASHRAFMNQEPDNSTSDIAERNTIKLLSIITAPLTNASLAAYTNAIESYKSKMAKDANYDYAIRCISRLERHIRSIQSESKQK